MCRACSVFLTSRARWTRRSTRGPRKFVWSESNPWFFRGTAGEGIGGPHIGRDMVWPMSQIIYALTSNSDSEILHAIQMLKASSAGTGFMHESYNKDDPSQVHKIMVCVGQHALRRTYRQDRTEKARATARMKCCRGCGGVTRGCLERPRAGTPRYATSRPHREST